MSLASFFGFAAGRSVNAPGEMWAVACGVPVDDEPLALSWGTPVGRDAARPVLAIHSLNIC